MRKSAIPIARHSRRLGETADRARPRRSHQISSVKPLCKPSRCAVFVPRTVGLRGNMNMPAVLGKHFGATRFPSLKRPVRRVRTVCLSNTSDQCVQGHPSTALVQIHISAWLRGRARLPGSRSSFTATCCGTAAATSWPMTARTPEPSSITSATALLPRQ
jgi:hypothetical protein